MAEECVLQRSKMFIMQETKFPVRTTCETRIRQQQLTF